MAVTLSEAVRRAAADLIGECRRRAAALAPRARIAWVDPERLHVTVRFIGTVEDDRAAAVDDALTPTVPLEPFACTLAGTGCFPGRGQPRVVWAGVTSGLPNLVALEHEVSRRLTGIGLEPDWRPYAPHLTLGRVREAAGLRGERLLHGLADAGLGTMTVDRMTLFESRLSPKGPDYVPRLATPLGAAGP